MRLGVTRKEGADPRGEFYASKGRRGRGGKEGKVENESTAANPIANNLKTGDPLKSSRSPPQEEKRRGGTSSRRCGPLGNPPFFRNRAWKDIRRSIENNHQRERRG